MFYRTAVALLFCCLFTSNAAALPSGCQPASDLMDNADVKLPEDSTYCGCYVTGDHEDSLLDLSHAHLGFNARHRVSEVSCQSLDQVCKLFANHVPNFVMFQRRHLEWEKELSGDEFSSESQQKLDEAIELENRYRSGEFNCYAEPYYKQNSQASYSSSSSMCYAGYC